MNVKIIAVIIIPLFLLKLLTKPFCKNPRNNISSEGAITMNIIIIKRIILNGSELAITWSKPLEFSPIFLIILLPNIDSNINSKRYDMERTEITPINQNNNPKKISFKICL